MASDRTAAFTLEHGQVAFGAGTIHRIVPDRPSLGPRPPSLIAVDPCSAECVGIHAALNGTRRKAPEPIRQGVTERFGGVEKGAAKGLSIRHDHGSQYMSRDFQKEIVWLGAFGPVLGPTAARPSPSPAFVRAPEGNGCAERHRHRARTVANGA